ncbi:MAG: HyaD/HybD family hydrogenase maturation endopeptidase [Gammaproteobacteria bacterium]|nr:HyaD/HybD family hydrogenase maturation endopeptidase [Gammaproteobacteria bacterium]
MVSDETLILGIGNTLLTDEGAGIHALNHFQSQYPDIPNLTFIDGGTLSFTLAVWIEDCSNLIVFDATELHQPAGTVKTFVGTAMDDFLGNTKRSAHEVGLLDLMDIARLTEHLPKNRALIGIQPEIMDWGMAPSAPVQSALDTATNEAFTLVKLWQEVNTDQKTPTSKDYRNSIKEELR